MKFFKFLLLCLCLLLPVNALASSLSSPNVPLDSPVYLYIEKLSGFGLVRSDFKGVRPYSRSEVARLLQEAEEKLGTGDYPPLAGELVERVRELIPREAASYGNPEQVPRFGYDLVSNARLRYVYLDGAPRNYNRPLIDRAGDWTFPLPHWRPRDTNPGVRWQKGYEGTPLFENNEGVVYDGGSNLEAKLSSEMYLGRVATGVIEPLFLFSEHDDFEARINKYYVKVGGGALELELGRDANWLGPGYRGAITLTNNAPNFTGVKLSSPEPLVSRYLWDLKYELLVARFNRTRTATGQERQPYFYATKLTFKPLQHIELGLDLGRQVGGPGVHNDAGYWVRGLFGATGEDNSNTVAGVDMRFRLPWLRNSEIYGEISGEDRNGFWPKAQSYVGGFFIPALTRSGRDDLRFEYFLGHQILYTNSTFPAGYIYHDFPVGHSQGGATEDFFLRYSHWFSARNTAALDCIWTTRGTVGRVTVDANGRYDAAGVMQGVERKLALRGSWYFPVSQQWSALLLYGWENIENWNLQPGVDRTNNLVRAEMTYRY